MGNLNLPLTSALAHFCRESEREGIRDQIIIKCKKICVGGEVHNWYLIAFENKANGYNIKPYPRLFFILLDPQLTAFGVHKGWKPVTQDGASCDLCTLHTCGKVGQPGPTHLQHLFCDGFLFVLCAVPFLLLVRLALKRLGDHCHPERKGGSHHVTEKHQDALQSTARVSIVGSLSQWYQPLRVLL